MESSTFNDRRKRKRLSRERRFRFYGISAIVMAISFLLFFFVDIIQKGYKAFAMTEIHSEMVYSQDAVEIPQLAFQEDVRDFVSYSVARMIPSDLERNPSLMGKNVVKWVVASDEVDQYAKGSVTRLTEDEQRRIDELKRQGRLRLSFNTRFFAAGDSKLPEVAGIFSAVVGSLYVIALTVLFSVPIGVMSALYLQEFAPDNFLTRLIEVNISNLAAIPSIIFGLLGLSIFINFFGVPRSSALAGGLTLALMTLPVIIISTRASIGAVPDSIRHGAYAVGASKLQMVLHHLLPLAVPGITTGTIIGIARALGETAPLLIIGMMAYIPDIPSGITEAATVLPAQIYTWSSASQRAFVEKTAAGIMVLLAVMLLLNATAIWLRRKYEIKW
ncbi:phosphate ABC transporter, inner membrane subunit PstA [Chlorobium limicola DSM 245]|uniref:Phosphate transport system permease protein PstA n=1 Tax=Chlorobium limicola (strain DSM 245 / NBRC 103803 / 6330) TaxID=290315 RepID=B3EFI8_CHLL2|nr:phosphate ABC transporter permease PstA [Chlorobium limicola]ACD89471.1 phosphate ABC transporter, inner membrane subunit PstA [Chlorobium limicola DSM 245]